MSEKKVQLYSPLFFELCAAGGAIACGVSHAALTPQDLVKTNMQLYPKEFTGNIQGFSRIWRGEAANLGFGTGLRGIYKGFALTLVGYSLQGMGKYGFYEYFKYKYASFFEEKTAKKYKDLIYMSASASAEFFADIALCPFEAVRVRVQTRPKYAKGLIDGFPKMAAEGNLFAGIVPLWGRQIPYTVMKFVAFERLAEVFFKQLDKRYKPENQLNSLERMGVIFAAGYASGVLSALVSQPADNMVSQINNLKREGSFWTKMRFIYSGDSQTQGIGFKGLWKGLGPRIILVGTLTGIQWFLYGAFKEAVGLPAPGTSSGNPLAEKK